VIVIDTSAWIANQRNQITNPVVAKVRHPDVIDRLLIGDIVMAEILQGARDEKDALRLEVELRQFPIVTMGGDALAVQAARHYRRMRAAGFTMKIADLLIGAFCIEHSHELLQCDADFEPMVRVCGLLLLA
jgi:predicted nucleic acid-binding protein